MHACANYTGLFFAEIVTNTHLSVMSPRFLRPHYTLLCALVDHPLPYLLHILACNKIFILAKDNKGCQKCAVGLLIFKDICDPILGNQTKSQTNATSI